MTDMNAALEMAYYYDICKLNYPDDFKDLITLDTYTNTEKYCAIAETAYFNRNGRLPAWASVIDRVESDGVGGWILVHRDTGKDN